MKLHHSVGPNRHFQVMKKTLHGMVVLMSFIFRLLFGYMSHILHTYMHSTQHCITVTRAILHVARLATHTTLNIHSHILYPWILRGHLNTDVQAGDQTRNLLITRTTPMTARYCCLIRPLISILSTSVTSIRAMRTCCAMKSYYITL